MLEPFFSIRKILKEMFIITKIFVFVLIMAILDVIYEGFQFWRDFKLSRKPTITRTREIILAVAISYIMTIIFTGFKI